MFGLGRKGSKRRLHLRSAGRAVWSPGQRRLVAALALLVTLPALGWGLHRLVRYYLLESGRFVLRAIEIEAGDTITRDRICEYLKLREGMPLFAIDIHLRLITNETAATALLGLVHGKIGAAKPLGRHECAVVDDDHNCSLLIDAVGHAIKIRAGGDMLR